MLIKLNVKSMLCLVSSVSDEVDSFVTDPTIEDIDGILCKIEYPFH